MNTTNQDIEALKDILLQDSIDYHSLQKIDNIIRENESSYNVIIAFIIMNIHVITTPMLYSLFNYNDNYRPLGYINALIYEELLIRDPLIDIGRYSNIIIDDSLDGPENSILLWIIDVGRLCTLYNSELLYKIISGLNEYHLEEIFIEALYSSSSKTYACYNQIVERCKELDYDSEYLQKFKKKYSP